ncbi:hypothetical protein [Actinoplanes aureus]|uniref:hypothetical protein n=1 Tax=Actinoplanes aureus TaxID=2792083 RepID=UPI001E2AA2BE|nr:hypothetical protein [Actinoplanes aureus]
MVQEISRVLVITGGAGLGEKAMEVVQVDCRRLDGQDVAGGLTADVHIGGAGQSLP